MKKMMDEDSSPNDADDRKGYGGMGRDASSVACGKGGFGSPASPVKTTAKRGK